MTKPIHGRELTLNLDNHLATQQIPDSVQLVMR